MRESDTASSAMWTAIIPRRRSGRTTGYIILTDIRRTLKVRKNGKRERRTLMPTDKKGE